MFYSLAKLDRRSGNLAIYEKLTLSKAPRVTFWSTNTENIILFESLDIKHSGFDCEARPNCGLFNRVSEVSLLFIT